MKVMHLSELEFLKCSGNIGDLTTLFPKSVSSTNILAAEMFCGLPLLIATEKQTAGRGTRGRSFLCCDGKGLYMSLAAYEESFSVIKDIITPAVAVAVSNVLNDLYGIQFDIKWVNDIVYNDKKLCGILCERKLLEGRAYIIIGIGINYETEFLPDDIRRNSAGLLEFTDSVDSNVLLSEISDKLLLLNSADRIEIVNRYREISSILGREVFWSANENRISVKALDFDENCNLIVDDGEKILTLNCGDVSIKVI